MSANDWSIDFTDVDKLIENMSKIPNRSEEVINKSLQTKGAPLAMSDIQVDIPISPFVKRHAHSNKALNVTFANLQFTIRPKRQFEYIKYPDLAIGTSKNNAPKQFMKKGLQKAEPKIVKDLTDSVIEEINKTLGGK
nr:hypothetical protein [Heyndrickxia oleronia]